LTLPLLVVGLILVLAAALTGGADNLSGMLEIIIGLGLLVFAGVHHWREARLFGNLFVVALLGFPILMLIHHILKTLDEHLATLPVLHEFLLGFSVISFSAAFFLAPAAALTGLLAGLFYLIKSKI